MATECFLYSSLCIIIGRPGDDISSNLYSMSHTLSTGPFGSTSLVTTTAGNGIPFGAVPFLLWSLFLLIGWTVELNLRDELKSVKLTVLIQSGQNWTDQFTDSPTRASGLTSFCFFLRVFPVLVRSGPRTRFEPLGPGPIGFGPWIPDWYFDLSTPGHTLWPIRIPSIKRHYECPILLIEFEAGKPFALKALRVKTYQIKELMQKLVLTILHFPTVRILWSATSTDTAVMFGQLKDDQDEPVLSEAQAINAGK